MRSDKRHFDRLDQFLLDLVDNDEAMLIEELDGFLAGIVVCPEMIMPSRWLPYVWSYDGDHEQAPVFDNGEQAQNVMDLIMAHYNAIATSLHRGLSSYEPIFAVNTITGETLWETWAEGFGRAMALSPASWLRIVESRDQKAFDALTGLRALQAIATGDSKLPASEEERLIQQAPDLIPDWVETLNAWRLARASGSTATSKPQTPRQGGMILAPAALAGNTRNATAATKRCRVAEELD